MTPPQSFLSFSPEGDQAKPWSATTRFTRDPGLMCARTSPRVRYTRAYSWIRATLIDGAVHTREHFSQPGRYRQHSRVTSTSTAPPRARPELAQEHAPWRFCRDSSQFSLPSLSTETLVRSEYRRLLRPRRIRRTCFSLPLAMRPTHCHFTPPAQRQAGILALSAEGERITSQRRLPSARIRPQSCTGRVRV